MIKKNAHRLLLLLLCTWCFQSCSQEKPDKDIPEPPGSIEEIYAMAKKADNLRSLIISRDHQIVAEKYYDHFGEDSLEHLRSATKSIMTILIGIAVDKGMIDNITDPIHKYLGDVPEDKREIQIQHLMNMKSGITWDEGIGYNDNNKMIDSGNPYRHMMDLPMAGKPGSRWEYSTGDIHLLSVVLSEASGMDTRSFAQRYLFDPLNIRDFSWQKFGDGYFSGGSRLQLKPHDMLKIGLMCANGGVYNDQRILSKAYLEASTDVLHVFNEDDKQGVKEGYGYGWWTIVVNGTKAFMASGYAGQTIAVIPKEKLVVVMTHRWRVNGEKAIEQQDAAQDIAVAAWMWTAGNSLVTAN